MVGSYYDKYQIGTNHKKGVIHIACYNPLIRLVDLTKWETAQDGHKYHPAKVTGQNSINWSDGDFWNSGHTKVEVIPCKQCIGCQLDYSAEWADRGYLEQQCWNESYFITLTYADEHLPDDHQLKPEHWEKFIHDLRQNQERQNKHTGIRYIMCGEYGEESCRPHYHAILFNCPLKTETFYNPRVKWKKYTYFQNTEIEKCWQYGISNICEATWNNVAYVARYVTKKIGNLEGKDFYEKCNIQGEFFRCSTHPGIGYYYYKEHKEEIYKNDYIIIRNNKGIHKKKPPKYFDKLYEKENPKHMKEIKEKRNNSAIWRLREQENNTGHTKWEQLQIEKSTKEAKTKILKRKVEDIHG